MAEKKIKRLYRSRDDRMIAGICGGIGEYTNTDPTIWRIIFFVLLLPGGLPGLIPYIIMWIIVPKKPTA
jgi:phage shock protein PspC (stress-responsive transcriptional regulator)